ncbi:MAG: hypothetical protein QNL12_10135, partial [Acidimicrobiia bacterium]|nr:hypothetical protein [Acidimicrobiia bacterium]MDX2467664.1 hypothetical protein [Acidimicrobiia bacterium]
MFCQRNLKPRGIRRNSNLSSIGHDHRRRYRDWNHLIRQTGLGIRRNSNLSLNHYRCSNRRDSCPTILGHGPNPTLSYHWTCRDTQTNWTPNPTLSYHW